MEQSRSASRVPAVDILRGAVMVLMALDHVRDFVTNLRFQPENLARGTAALFASRWVTHFCAPVFALVLWALGFSMIVMAALVHLPKGLVAAFALALIAGHNLFDGVRPADWGAFAPLWNVLHVPGFAIPGRLLVAYPLIPWAGVMALGYVVADVYQGEPARRRRVLIGAGVAATVLFVALRTLNAYGNPFPWTTQRTTGLTVASFLNVLKYPPSLQFLLMTLGPVLVALALLERARGRVAGWLEVIGRVPLFFYVFYVVHIYLAHLAGMTIAFVQSGEMHRIPVVTDPGAVPPWFGVSLPGVYVAWAIVVLAMYPLCLWYGRLKQRRDDWWLGYS